MLVQPVLAQTASPEVQTTAAPRFADEGPLTSDTGHVALSWTAQEPVTITLSGNGQADRSVFGGQGETLFLSGLDDGDYMLSIAPDGADATDQIALEVRHQSLTRALLLTLLGGIVFLMTLAVILRGARNG